MEEIEFILHQRPEWEVKLVYKEGNSIAHDLVRRALHMTSDVFWMEEGPNELMSLIDKEKICIS